MTKTPLLLLRWWHGRIGSADALTGRVETQTHHLKLYEN
jgi:hypothetical protein